MHAEDEKGNVRREDRQEQGRVAYPVGALADQRAGRASGSRGKRGATYEERRQMFVHLLSSIFLLAPLRWAPKGVALPPLPEIFRDEIDRHKTATSCACSSSYLRAVVRTSASTRGAEALPLSGMTTRQPFAASTLPRFANNPLPCIPSASTA